MRSNFPRENINWFCQATLPPFTNDNLVYVNTCYEKSGLWWLYIKKDIPDKGGVKDGFRFSYILNPLWGRIMDWSFQSWYIWRWLCLLLYHCLWINMLRTFAMRLKIEGKMMMTHIQWLSLLICRWHGVADGILLDSALDSVSVRPFLSNIFTVIKAHNLGFLMDGMKWLCVDGIWPKAFLFCNILCLCHHAWLKFGQFFDNFFCVNKVERFFPTLPKNACSWTGKIYEKKYFTC